MRKPCLTLWQPYASLVCAGIKVHETRSWRCPTELIGQRICIHAAAKQFVPGDLPAPLLSIVLKTFSGRPEPLPVGAMVGTALIRSCERTQDTSPANKHDEVAGDWRRGRFAWLFEEPREFLVARPIRGSQGIWYCERPDVFLDD